MIIDKISICQMQMCVNNQRQGLIQNKKHILQATLIEHQQQHPPQYKFVHDYITASSVYVIIYQHDNLQSITRL